MPLKELILKVKNFLKDEENKDIKKTKIIKILDELVEKKQKLKRHIQVCENKKKKEELQEKLEAVKKLIKKTKKLI
ncbi:hypothetical protein CRU98_00465 [Arcobacter sp. CECT 8986]|uniref:hypothetical protein n=1 Tax=Arcobacter sp. CECT 8986 TaxID=2044507 RepID=UPI001009F57C|nr:hypothetical protein [Arcobacter sp. CECT 8986]RXK00957.1 hypothetical protein CRU98_00465 [Arcobacter sp. CECT 8986]